MIKLIKVVGEIYVKKMFLNRSKNGAGSKLSGKLLRDFIRKGTLTTLLLSPMLAQALGLGALTTNSALNEPFDGRVQLLNTTSAELQTISVNLAGVEQFKNAGIERPFLLSSLKFEIVEDPAGNYLQISSEESIKEPFLNFLLEVNWAKGRLIREYTALLDPPVFDTNTRVVDTTDTAVSAPTQAQNIKIEQLPDETLVSDAATTESTIAPVAQSKPVSKPRRSYSHDEPVVYQESFKQQSSPTRTPVPASPTPTPRSKVQPDLQPFSLESSYTTTKGDTLWKIAQRGRPDRSVSIQQMMLSMLNTNPNAFIDNNINRLKTGQVLRIPDKSEIDQLTRAEAISLVKEHNSLWDDYRQGLASTAAVRPAGVASSAGTIVEKAVEPEIMSEPELRLVTATESGSESGTSGTGSDLAIAKTLEDELALANEQLVSGKNENAELKDQLKESDEIVALLKQQVELKNEELAAIQKKLREANLANDVEELVAEAEEGVISKDEGSAMAELEEEMAAMSDAEEFTDQEEEETVSKVEEEMASGSGSDVEETDQTEESIDDILAQLEQEEAATETETAPTKDTVYLENTEDLKTNTTSYEEYDTPVENLSGQESETQYLTTDLDVTGQDITETLDEMFEEEPVLAETEDVLGEMEMEEVEVEVDGLEPETGILATIQGMVPSGLMDMIPGGIKTVIGVVLGFLVLLLLGLFKMFGGKSKEDAEILDLLDPSALEEVEAEGSFEAIVEDVVASSEEKVDEATAEEVEEVVATSEPVESTEQNSEADDDDFLAGDFDIDFEEDLDDTVSSDITADDTILSEKNIEEEVVDVTADLSNDEFEIESDDELLTEGLVDLDDTLEQIKPLLEQTEEEEEEEDPLEEVNLSLAYEQFDKAEMLVKKAIEDHPEQDGYKLRLLEVHYAANDMDAYESAAKSLQEVTDGEGHLWESAVAMWTEMSPERELFEEVSVANVAIDPSVEEASQEEDSLVDSDADLSLEAPEVEGDDDILNIAEDDSEAIESPEIDTSEAIDIAGEVSDLNDDFLNIAEADEAVENEVLDVTQLEDKTLETIEPVDLSMDIDEELEIDLAEDLAKLDTNEMDLAEIEQDSIDTVDELSIDMLDITAVGDDDSLDLTHESDGIDIDDSDAEELFELSNELKSDDESLLSTTTADDETLESAEIIEFSPDDLTIDDNETIPAIDTTELESDLKLVSDGEPKLESVTEEGDDELDSLAKSLEDTISGLETGDLDDISFEFDSDSTLESTFASTLGASSDLDLDNEGDEIDTKLNLAKAYIELGDAEGAKDILHEVTVDGNDEQKKDAQKLLEQIS